MFVRFWLYVFFGVIVGIPLIVAAKHWYKKEIKPALIAVSSLALGLILLVFLTAFIFVGESGPGNPPPSLGECLFLGGLCLTACLLMPLLYAQAQNDAIMLYLVGIFVFSMALALLGALGAYEVNGLGLVFGLRLGAGIALTTSFITSIILRFKRTYHRFHSITL